jgi:PAS domain S-box-containing protein
MAMTKQEDLLTEAVYRSIVEGSPIAKVLINRDGEIALVNAQLETLFGYTRDELLGKPIEFLVPKAVRSQHPSHRDSHSKSPELRYMGVGRDLSVARKDGSEFPVEIALNPIQTSQGEFVLWAVTDITERKRGEEKFRAVVEASPTAMIMINEAGDIVLTNAQTSKLFGYTAEELMGQKVDILVPDNVRPNHPGMRNGFFSDPQPRQMGVGRDLNGRRKDGSLMPVEIGLNPLVTSEGKFAVAAIADISERKRNDERSRDAIAEKQASEYARSLIEASLDPLVTISPEGKITDVNDGSIKVTGVAREGLIGTDFSDYFTEPDKAREGYQKVFANGSVTDYPLTIRHKDGHLTDVLYNASEYKDIAGNVQGVFAAARDVTMQKQSSGYARSLIEASLDPLVTISPEGKITDVNEGSIKVTGVAREGLIGTDFSDYFTEPDKAREGYQKVFAKGSVTDYPLTIRHKDGHLTDVLYNASVYKDAAGNGLGVFAAARDVTKQREAESEVGKQRTKEMQRLAELERFQKLTVGRELKMIELKQEIEELKKRVSDVS